VLSGLSRVAGVEASPDGLRLRVTLRLAQGERAEVAITEAVDALIRSGATLGTVVRGHSLEERFLELT
jgi:hypothetical protein